MFRIEDTFDKERRRKNSELRLFFLTETKKTQKLQERLKKLNLAHLEEKSKINRHKIQSEIDEILVEQIRRFYRSCDDLNETCFENREDCVESETILETIVEVDELKKDEKDEEEKLVEALFEEPSVNENKIQEIIVPDSDEGIIVYSFGEKADEESGSLLKGNEDELKNKEGKISEKIDGKTENNIEEQILEIQEFNDTDGSNIYRKMNSLINLGMWYEVTEDKLPFLKFCAWDYKKKTRKHLTLLKYLIFNTLKEKWNLKLENKPWTTFVYDPGKC